MGDDDCDIVCRLLGAVDRACGQTVGRGFGQCIGAQGHPANAEVASAKGDQAVLSAALQPGAQPHREAVAQNEVRMDGVQGSGCSHAGD